MTFADFQLAALHQALDEQRQSRGLTWKQAMLEINLAEDGKTGRHPIAQSTVAGLRTKAVAEGDGVLQMLRWLNRPPESFVPGFEVSEIHRLPNASPGQVLRFDTGKLHAAVDAERIARGLTWQQVASETGWPASGLIYLKKGSRIGFPDVMRITRWLGRPAADFVRIAST